MIIRLPKAGALALLHRTAVRAQAETSTATHKGKGEGEAEERERREVAVGARLVVTPLEMTGLVNGLKRFGLPEENA